MIKVMGNLSYTDRTIVRKNSRSKEIEEDETNRRFIERTNHKSDVEISFMQEEYEDELLGLAKGTLVEEFLLGSSVESIAARHSIDVPLVKKRLLEDLKGIYKLGISKLDWDQSALKKLQVNMRHDSDQRTLPTSYELWNWFADNNTDLNQLMAIIDTLDPIQKNTSFIDLDI
jgi:hypothetical protein